MIAQEVSCNCPSFNILLLVYSSVSSNGLAHCAELSRHLQMCVNIAECLLDHSVMHARLTVRTCRCSCTRGQCYCHYRFQYGGQDIVQALACGVGTLCCSSSVVALSLAALYAIKQQAVIDRGCQHRSYSV
eukprot:5773-Heterococcus_DN1.PRE.6